jgi:hypothetical protein
MSFAQVLKELPGFTAEERQILLHRVLELEDRSPSSVEEALVDARLVGHKANPSSSVPLDNMRKDVSVDSLIADNSLVLAF